MTVEIKSLGELELWDRPSAGHVANSYNRDWFQHLPPFSMIVALTFVFLPDGSISRFLRLAVALPALHAIALVFSLFYVPSLDIPELGDRTPMMEILRVEWLFAGGLLLSLLLARLIGLVVTGKP